MSARRRIGWLVGIAALVALMAGVRSLKTDRENASTSPTQAEEIPRQRLLENPIGPEADRAKLPLAAVDPEELRTLGLEVLETFRVSREAPGVLPENVRERLLVRRGAVDLGRLSQLDPGDGAALADFLSDNRDLVDGFEDDLTDLVISEGRAAWCPALLRFLAQSEGPAARSQAARLGSWAFERAIREDIGTYEGQDSTDPDWQGPEPWETFMICANGIASRPSAEYLALLPSLSRVLEATSELPWSAQDHPEHHAYLAITGLAGIDTPEAASAVRALLGSSSWKVRQAAADGAVAAIGGGTGGALLESLGAWASEVIHGVVVVPREVVRLAWVVFATRGDEALTFLDGANVSPEDGNEYFAWAHAVLRAARSADPDMGRRAVRDLFEGPRAIGLSRSEDLQRTAYATLAEVGDEEDWTWICERARSATDFTSLYVLEAIPAERWRGREGQLERLIADLSTREDKNGASIMFGLISLAEIAPDLLSSFRNSPNAQVADAALTATRNVERGRGAQAFEDLSKSLERLEPVERLPLLLEALDSLPGSMRGMVEEALVQLGGQMACEELEVTFRSQGSDPETRALLLTGLLQAPSRGRCGVEPYRERLPALVAQAVEGQRPDWLWDLLRSMAILAVLEGKEERGVVARSLPACVDPPYPPKSRWTEAIDLLRSFLERADALGADRIF